MKKDFKIGNKRKSFKSFQPSRETINNAVNQFLEKGGNVTKVTNMPENYDNYIAKSGMDTKLADEFLQDII